MSGKAKGRRGQSKSEPKDKAKPKGAYLNTIRCCFMLVNPGYILHILNITFDISGSSALRGVFFCQKSSIFEELLAILTK